VGREDDLPMILLARCFTPLPNLTIRENEEYGRLKGVALIVLPGLGTILNRTKKQDLKCSRSGRNQQPIFFHILGRNIGRNDSEPKADNNDS
jgi:hypothetical protein